MEAEGNPLVRLRLCRRHYGTPVSEPWDPFTHHPDDFYIHAHRRTRMARGELDKRLLFSHLFSLLINLFDRTNALAHRKSLTLQKRFGSSSRKCANCSIFRGTFSVLQTPSEQPLTAVLLSSLVNLKFLSSILLPAMRMMLLKDSRRIASFLHPLLCPSSLLTVSI
jgi:hypothetical protein